MSQIPEEVPVINVTVPEPWRSVIAQLQAERDALREALVVARQYVQMCAIRDGWFKKDGNDLQAIDAILAKK